MSKQNNKSNFMKNYVKAQVVAKNSPEGSYAAGCPESGTGYYCKQCERTK
jgi:hypothetical protein